MNELLHKLSFMWSRLINDFFLHFGSRMIDRCVSLSCMESNWWHFNAKGKLSVYDIKGLWWWPACLSSDFIIQCVVPLLKRNLNSLWLAQLYCSIFSVILDYYQYTGNFNGHEVQSRGFSLVGEKIDLSFPAGFLYTLAGLYKAKWYDRISVSQRYSYKNDWFVDWIFHSLHILCHVPATAL